MSVTIISFEQGKGRGFAREQKRANAYFEEHDLSRHTNAQMVTKTIILLTLYFGAYALIISGLFYPPWQILFLCFVMGIGMSGIGFSVSHEALYGVYSSNNTVNKLLRPILRSAGCQWIHLEDHLQRYPSHLHKYI